MSDRARGLVTLSARYPDGSLGWAACVFGGLTEADLEGPETAACDAFLEEVIAGTIAYYHRLVGQAYSLDDFAFTFWFADSIEELFALCGEAPIFTARAPGFERPNVAGPSGPLPVG